MIDFSSSLYLGMKHASAALRPWSQFTTGIPAALGSPSGAEEAASRLAALQGCERGLLGRSTLHLFWDLFGILAQGRIEIFIDAATYPIARWGTERAAARGILVQTIRHHDANMLMKLARNAARRGMRPIMVADGFCPGCGTAAPLREYLAALRSVGGIMVLDDTQALGIFGASPAPDAPFGIGGGGILPWSDIIGPDVLAVSSLAKGFGVPVAVIVGSDPMIRRFQATSETRMYCSPPSLAEIYATEHALNVNERFGEPLRLHLACLVQYFRAKMAEAGHHFSGGLFPIQTLATASSVDLVSLFGRLVGLGIRPVLHRNRHNHGPCISLIVTCRHTRADIDSAVDAIVRCLAFELKAREECGTVVPVRQSDNLIKAISVRN